MSGLSVKRSAVVVAQQKRREFLRLGWANGRESQLRVIGLLAPLVAVLRTIVGQEQHLAGHTLAQRLEKSLGLAVDPMQIFKDENQRLVETLAQEELLERLERALPSNLRVHLL